MRISQKTDWNRQKKVRLALAILFILFLLLFINQIVKLSQTFFGPISQSEKKNYLWNGNFNLNLVVKGDQIWLLSLDPKEKKAVIVNIPDQTYVDLPAGLGSWQIRAVYPLGQTETPPQGARFLKQSVSYTFGIPVDGILELKDLQETVSQIERWRQNPLNLLLSVSKLRTDLSPSEFIRFSFSFWQIRFDKLTKLNLEDYLDERKLPDNTAFLTADYSKIDSLESFREEAITSERLSVAVYNSTKYPGLAAKAARIIKNMGGDVVIVSSIETPFDKTVVLGVESKTRDRLEQVFSLACLQAPKCDKIAITDMDDFSRAQVLVILGEDFYQRF